MTMIGFRNQLSVFLAVAAAVFAGYAYITTLHYNAAKANMDRLRAANSYLAETNKGQAEALAKMVLQRSIDSTVVNRLSSIEQTIFSSASAFETTIQGLSYVNEEASNYLSGPIDDDVARLLTQNDIRNAGSDGGAPGQAGPQLPNTAPGELRGEDNRIPGEEQKPVQNESAPLCCASGLVE